MNKDGLVFNISTKSYAIKCVKEWAHKAGIDINTVSELLGHK